MLVLEDLGTFRGGRQQPFLERSSSLSLDADRHPHHSHITLPPIDFFSLLSLISLFSFWLKREAYAPCYISLEPPFLPPPRTSRKGQLPGEAGLRPSSSSFPTYLHAHSTMEQGFAPLTLSTTPLPLNMHNELFPTYLPRPLQTFFFSRVVRHLSGRPRKKTG